MQPSLLEKGLLRKEVEISTSAKAVTISHSMWEISLPREWMETQPALEAILSRKTRGDAKISDSQAEAVVRMLALQGCFHVDSGQEEFTLLEARDIFDAFKSRWYALYYSHPTWQRLRTGEATRAELAAWAVHNYHISRIAGPVGARIVSSSTDLTLKKFFRQDCLEEYWHCDAFYFVKHPKLNLSIKDVKSYVPLASSLAFEDLTLQMARRNSLAHLLIAYFQESTVMFEKDCNKFYHQVEQAYGVTGFFDGWKKHIKLDQEHGHADGLSELFEEPLKISRRDLQSAIGNAWLAYYYLNRGLDDIFLESAHGDQLNVRLIFDNDADSRDRQLTSWIKQAFECAGPPDASQLLSWWNEKIRRIGIGANAAADGKRLMKAAAASVYRSLGNARRHDDIITLGRLCEVFHRAVGEDVVEPQPSDYSSPWAAAVASRLGESTYSPHEYLLTLQFLSPALPESMPAQLEKGGLQKAFESMGSGKSGMPEALLESAIQATELIDRWLRTNDTVDSASFTL